MSRLDRYVLREVLVPFVFAVGAVLVVVLLLQLQRLATAALGLALTPADAGVIFLATLPPFLILAVPIAYLLSVVMGLGRLSGDRELIAVRASGVGAFRVARAPIAVGVLVSLATLPLAHFGEPYGLNMLYARLIDVGMRNVAQAIRPGVFNEDFSGIALFARERAKDGKLQDVLVYDERSQEAPILLLAQTGELLPVGRDPAKIQLQLELEAGEIHLGSTARDARYDRVRFGQLQLGIDAASELKDRTRFVSVLGRMSSASMVVEAEKLGPLSRLGRRIEKTYWRRYSFPLMALVFGLLGAAIVMSGGPRARARNAILALGSVALYYVLMRLGDFAVVQYENTAELAAFGPNVAMLLLGVVGLIRSGRPA